MAPGPLCFYEAEQIPRSFFPQNVLRQLLLQAPSFVNIRGLSCALFPHQVPYRPVVAARVHLGQNGLSGLRHRGGRPPRRLAEDQRQQNQRQLAAAHGPGRKPLERAARLGGERSVPEDE